MMRTTMGDAYCERLFAAYTGRTSAEADLVCYWFVRAREAMEQGAVQRVGLVATNSIRGGVNRRVLDAIAETSSISDAWSDEPWTIEGAAVRVSLVCFAPQPAAASVLDGFVVPAIRPDLTGSASDLTTARRLPENAGVAFMGDTKGGAFDIPGAVARKWLALPSNANGRMNSEVLRPWANGRDVTRRSSDTWIIDFGWTMDEADAAFFSAPFGYAATHVRPVRLTNNREAYARNWWRHVEPRPGMHAALRSLGRFIVTPEAGKHRIFAWMKYPAIPDHQLQVIARDDDTAFGLLHSAQHLLWVRALGSPYGNHPTARRYNISRTYETFPFPDGLTPNLPAASYADNPAAQRIAAAARDLVEKRDRWLNPPELIDIVPEVVPGFPDRIVPKNEKAAAILNGRTLTNLYNTRGTPAGTWLDNLHRTLDEAVAAAYGWPADLPDDEVLARLLALNHARPAPKAT